MQEVSVRARRNSAWVVVGVLIVFAFVFPILPCMGQGQSIRISEPQKAMLGGENPLAQAMNKAQLMLNDGLATMNESTLRRAAQAYEKIIEDYSLDPGHFDAYFAAAHIFMEYLQSYPDYQHAQNLMTLLINNHPSNFPYLVDAYLTRAHLEYRCLRDYKAAQEDLSKVLNTPSLSAELGVRDIEAKVLLAKCRQKLGEYDKAKIIWDELNIIDPSLDTEGRSRWIAELANWSYISDSRIRMFLENNIDSATYKKCFESLRKSIDEVELIWKISAIGTIDVYLYSSSDSLFDYTTRTKSFALPLDAEIHLSTADLDDITHLVGWVLSHNLNTRPAGTVFPLLRAGLSHFFAGSRKEIDKQAAKALHYYGDSIKEYDLLFPFSYEGTFLHEYNMMAASFTRYLIEDRNVSISSIEKFYRLLWSRPDSRYQPPVIAALTKLSYGEGQARNYWQGFLIPQQVYDLFKSVLNIDIPTEFVSWKKSLLDEIEEIKIDSSVVLSQIRKVQVDLSTPEKALESWWEAFKAGDFDGLIKASSKEMAEFFRDAKELYIQKGILEEVIVDAFIIPNKDAKLQIVHKGKFADEIYVFQLRIDRGNKVEDKTVVVRREGNVWKVDSN